MSYINSQRKKIVMVQKKNNRLKKKIIDLETMIAILKAKN